MKIFGYEPAAWAGVLQAVLGVLVVLNVGNLTDTTSVLVQAAAGAVFALVTAFYTKKVNLAVAVGAAQSVLALLVGFGLEVDPQLQAALIGGLQLALAGFLRQATEPAHEPGFNSEPLASEPLQADTH
jgi:drug/metabolite transporter (DMT)-like permease